MKILFDFLPLVFFFTTYKLAGRLPDQGSGFATHWLGALVQGGIVGATEAPALLATVVVLVATLTQVAWMKATGRKIDLMLWVSLCLIVVFGGLTVWFHNQMFIMWKPSIYSWLLGLLNLLVVYFFRDSWVSFHTFGSAGLSVAFVIGQGFYMSKHLAPLPASDKPTP